MVKILNHFSRTLLATQKVLATLMCRYISRKLRAYLHKMWMEGELVSTASHHPPANLQTRVRPHPARGETCQKNLAVLEKLAHKHSTSYGGSIYKSKPNHNICNHGQEAFF